MSARAVVNSHEQCVAAGGDRIVIYYTPNEYGRGSRSARFSVGHIRDGKPLATDPAAAWYDYRHKTFYVDLADAGHRNGNFHERKRQALAETLAWVKSRYGKTDFVRNRMGDYVEREVNEKFPLPKRIRKTDREK